MDSMKLGAGTLAAALASAALGMAPHKVCIGLEETIGCRHDGHVDQSEPEGPLHRAQTMTANGSTTAMPSGDWANLQFFFEKDSGDHTFELV